MQIPTLIINSEIPAIFTLNGTQLGNGEDNKVVLAVAPDNTYFVGIFPLQPYYIPIIRKVEINSGLIINELERDLKAIVWSKGLIELFFKPVKFYLPSSNKPGYKIISKQLKNGYTAMLYKNDGINFAIMNQDKVIFSQNIAPDGKASFEIIENDNDSYVAIRVKEIKEYLTVIKVNANVKLICSLAGDKITNDSNAIEIIADIPTALEYQKKELRDFKTGSIIKTEIGYFTKSEKNILSADDAVLALLDALKYNIEDDIDMLLGGELEGIPRDTLLEYFGEFDTAAIAPSQTGESIVVGLLNDERICNARLFAFEVEKDDNIYKIVNASENEN